MRSDVSTRKVFFDGRRQILHLFSIATHFVAHRGELIMFCADTLPTNSNFQLAKVILSGPFSLTK